MAKGQKRSNREIRKPKQDKVPPKAESPFAAKIKPTATTSVSAAKGKT